MHGACEGFEEDHTARTWQLHKIEENTHTSKETNYPNRADHDFLNFVHLADRAFHIQQPVAFLHLKVSVLLHKPLLVSELRFIDQIQKCPKLLRRGV